MPSKARDIIAGLTELPPEDCLRILDPNVVKCLPSNCTFKSIRPAGSSYWARSAAISTICKGKPRTFFLKLSRTDVGLQSLTGEYTSTQVIHAFVPGLSPEPLALGTYASDPNVHFYMNGYVDLKNEVPAVEKLSSRLAEMHSKTISPNRKFGFSVPTAMGACIQPNEWTSSWEKCFGRMMRIMFDFEQDVHGLDEDIQRMQQVLLQKVIPRLLRPLETEGRSIEPRFVHGDLWDGNTATRTGTGEAFIFDSSGFYGHAEYDLGAWNQPRHKIYRAYVDGYRRLVPPSAPEEDFEDRLILYRLRFNLTSSGCYLKSMKFRPLVIEDMKYLTDKFRDGYQGTAEAKGEEPLFYEVM